MESNNVTGRKQLDRHIHHAGLLAEVEDLRCRLAALEARLPKSVLAEGFGHGSNSRSATREASQDLGADALAPNSTASVSRRRAFGVGALVSLLAYISRSSARAADALTIDGGKVDVPGSLAVGGKLDFGSRNGERIKLYGDSHTIGIQGWTTYFRTGKNFAWYQGGSHDDGELKPGSNGKALMTLTPEGLSVSKGLSVPGSLAVSGKLDFGSRNGEHLKLYDDSHTIGIQGWTTYFRTGKNFAWYQGGSHDDGELKPGSNGKALMTLTPGQLTVAGAVKIGEKTDLYVAGGARQLRIVSGSVYWDGNDQGRGQADGYSVAKRGTGLYDIIFKTSFSALPGASVTQAFAGNVDPFGEKDVGEGGHVLDNAVIVGVSRTRLRIKTGTSGNNAADRSFSFIVIGPI